MNQQYYIASTRLRMCGKKEQALPTSFGSNLFEVNGKLFVAGANVLVKIIIIPHQQKCIARKPTPGLLLNKNIFPPIISVPWK